MENAVGLGGIYDAPDRAGVLELAIDDGHLAGSDETSKAGFTGDALAFVKHVELAAVAQILEVVQFATPAKGTEDLNVRVVIRQVLGQKTSDHTSNAGNQDAHKLSSGLGISALSY
jgi:hypothetical protein